MNTKEMVTQTIVANIMNCCILSFLATLAKLEALVVRPFCVADLPGILLYCWVSTSSPLPPPHLSPCALFFPG